MKTPPRSSCYNHTDLFSLSPQQDHWSLVQSPKTPLRPVCWHAHTSQDTAGLPPTLPPRCQSMALPKRGRPEFLQSSRPWKTSHSQSVGPALTRSFADEAGKGSHSTCHTSSLASESSRAQHSRHWETRRTEWISYQQVPVFLKADKCLGPTNPIQNLLVHSESRTPLLLSAP